MSTQSERVAQILAELQQKLASADASAAWLNLGDALAELDKLAPQSEDGRPWTDVVQEFHEGLGYGGLSVGHLQKVRRVRNFVRKVLEAEKVPPTDTEIVAAQVSALEVAERLHSLDPERGRAALIACIRDRRKFVDMRREYDEYVEQHPDRLPKKRATWLRKRKSSPEDDAALVEKVILAESVAILGATSAVLRPFQPSKSSPFLKSTDFGFRIAGSAGERTLGVELLADSALSTRDPAELLAQLEFQASFFDLYWIFAKADAAKIAWFSAILDEVRLDRVGLLRLAEDGWEAIRHPDGSSPVPDRRALVRLS
jgi:hypothetical protein